MRRISAITTGLLISSWAESPPQLKRKGQMGKYRISGVAELRRAIDLAFNLVGRAPGPFWDQAKPRSSSGACQPLRETSEVIHPHRKSQEFRTDSVLPALLLISLLPRTQSCGLSRLYAIATAWIQRAQLCPARARRPSLSRRIRDSASRAPDKDELRVHQASAR